MSGDRSGKVLVTGASGFIGRAVAAHLRSGGYKVRVASRDPNQFDLPREDRALMPAANAGAGAWDQLVSGVDHVVHCAGIADASAGLRYVDYRVANVDLSVQLAKAARRHVPGRFVFLSSIRAITGPTSPEVLTESSPARPSDDYGRSKIDAEEKLAEIFAADSRRLVTFRPVAVYGEGMRGGLAGLLRLAHTPFPLPLSGIQARRSLLDVERLGAAVLHILSNPVAGGTYIVSDSGPLTLAGIVSAMREGIGRNPGIFTIPEPLLGGLSAMVGRRDLWRRLSGPLVVSPDRLAATGWQPADDTSRRLAAYMAGRQAN